MPRRESPSVAVVGCGHWGKNLVRNFYELGVLQCVCESSPAGAESALTVAPNVPVVYSFAELLKSDVSAIVLATPAVSHFTMASQALRAGKDVFVEKPLALKHSEGLALVQLAEESQRILAVGHVLEYHPAFEALVKLYQSGELGELIYIYSHRLGWGKVRSEEDVLWSFAPHDLSMVLRLTGSLPERVMAVPTHVLRPDMPDFAQLTLHFGEKGPGAHIFVSWLHPFKEQRFVVIGSKGSANFDGVTGTLSFTEGVYDMTPSGPILHQAHSRNIEVLKDEPLKRECKAFLEAIATRRHPIADGTTGLRTLAVLEAAHLSLESKAWQDVPGVASPVP